MEFRPHGDWRIGHVGQVLVYQVRGPWNDQAAESFGQVGIQKAEVLKGRDWALFGDLTQWELAPQSMVPIARRIIDLAIRHGCVLECQILGSGNALTEGYVDTIEPTDGQRFRRHGAPDLHTALGILREGGFAEEADWIAREGLDAVLGPWPGTS